MSAAPTPQHLNERWGRGWWAMPLAVLLILGVLLVIRITKAPSPEDTALAAYRGAAAASGDEPAPTTTAAPKPAYFDYLGCDHNEETEKAEYCEPLLMWPLTAEARKIISGQEGYPGKLNMANAKAVARGVIKYGAIDQCQLSLGIEQRSGVDVRVVYPDLRKTKLVDCGTPAAGQ